MYRKLLFFIFFLFLYNYSYAETKLVVPEKLEIEELNKEERDRYKSIDYSSTLTMPEQYKGELKNSVGRPDVTWRDARIFIGAGGRYLNSKTTKLTPTDRYKATDYTYYTYQNEWKYKNDFNYYFLGGLYWLNGVRIEFEYSSMNLESKNYGKSFPKWAGPGIGHGYIFNQFLQGDAYMETINFNYNNGDESSYTILYNNSAPIVEFIIKTYMMNFVFEKSYITAKIKPYIGFGFGFARGDMSTLYSMSTNDAPAGQILIGFTYPLVENSLNLYLGGRYIYAKKMKQTFIRITNASFTNSEGIDVPDEDIEAAGGGPFTGTEYYNPTIFREENTYQFQGYSVDLGARFFF